LLWDNDGVLVDTEHLFYATNRDIFNEHGIDLTPANFFDWFLDANCGAWHLLSQKGYVNDTIDALRRERDQRYSEQLQRETAYANDGIEKILARLWKKIPMGVVTSAKLEHFNLIHRGLTLRPYFDFVVTEEDYQDSKPAPDPYLLGLKKIGLTAAECLAIEDSPRGLQAANAAGIKCIILRNNMTMHFPFEGAYRVVDSMPQLLDEIEAHL